VNHGAYVVGTACYEGACASFTTKGLRNTSVGPSKVLRAYFGIGAGFGAEIQLRIAPAKRR
jgi:hypothetical protein